MMKRIAAFLLCLLLLLPSAAALAQDTSSQRVFDNAGLFTEEQTAELETSIAAFRQRYNLDFAVLTNRKAYSGTAEALADDFYDQNGFGVGSERSGALFLIDLYDSAYHISTSGEAIDYLTDDRL